MTSFVEIRKDKWKGPWCLATVQVGETPTSTRQFRIAKTAKKGLAPDICAEPAVMLVADMPMCHRHAADCALRLVKAGEIAAAGYNPIRKRDVIDVTGRKRGYYSKD